MISMLIFPFIEASYENCKLLYILRFLTWNFISFPFIFLSMVFLYLKIQDFIKGSIFLVSITYLSHLIILFSLQLQALIFLTLLFLGQCQTHLKHNKEQDLWFCLLKVPSTPRFIHFLILGCMLQGLSQNREIRPKPVQDFDNTYACIDQLYGKFNYQT